jgi:glycosyltransferase involved in cell wall biosynthesis
MRILYFNYEWDVRDTTGAGTHIRELSTNLRVLGHTVIVHDRRPRPEAEHAGAGAVASGDARTLRNRLSPYLHETAILARSLRDIPVERGIIEQERPDALLTRYGLHRFSSLFAEHRCGVPIVFEVNAPAALEYRRYYSKYYHLLPALGEWTERRTLAAADAMFVVSNVLKRHFVDMGIPADRIAVVPNGADPERFCPGAADAELRERWGAGRVVVGFIGSFRVFHGTELLRHVIAEVASRRPTARFVMVGKGPGSVEIETYCRRKGIGEQVVFTGFLPRERIPAVAATMDILLAPYEPSDLFYFSPIKVFEYMASGRAVVAADVGQIGEVIRHGENGLLYDPRQPDALVDCVLRLIDDPALRANLGAAARRTVETDYTWRRNAERVAEVLEAARVRRSAGAR